MDRGQTAHDFALGISVFLLTVAFVFSTIPSLTASYEGDDTHDSIQATRIGSIAVEHLSQPDKLTRLDPNRTADFFSNHSSTTQLRQFFGLPARAAVNLSIRNESAIVELAPTGRQTTDLSAGDPFAGGSVTTAIRLVTFAGDSPCDPQCRLVVLVR